MPALIFLILNLAASSPGGDLDKMQHLRRDS